MVTRVDIDLNGIVVLFFRHKMATPGSSQVKIAQKTWEMANNIMEVSPEV